MLDYEKINMGQGPQPTEQDDDELVARFLMQRLPEINDDGFTERVVQSLPASRKCAARLWTLVCSLAVVVFIILLAVRGDLFSWIHMPTMQQVLAFVITAYTRLTMIHLNPLLIVGAAAAIIIALVVNIMGLVTDQEHFNDAFRYQQLLELRG